MTSNVRSPEEMRAIFRPEFLNRIDEIVQFEPLTREQLGEIVELQLRQLRVRLAERGLGLELTGRRQGGSSRRPAGIRRTGLGRSSGRSSGWSRTRSHSGSSSASSPRATRCASTSGTASSSSSRQQRPSPYRRDRNRRGGRPERRAHDGEVACGRCHGGRRARHRGRRACRRHGEAPLAGAAGRRADEPPPGASASRRAPRRAPRRGLRARARADGRERDDARSRPP